MKIKNNTRKHKSVKSRALGILIMQTKVIFENKKSGTL